MSRTDTSGKVQGNSPDTVAEERRLKVMSLLRNAHEFPPEARYVILRTADEVAARLPELVEVFVEAQRLADEGDLAALLKYYRDQMEHMSYSIIQHSLTQSVPSLTIQLPLPKQYAADSELQIGIAFPHPQSAESIKQGIEYAKDHQVKQLIGLLIIVTSLQEFLRGQARLVSSASGVGTAIKKSGVKLVSIFLQNDPRTLSRINITADHPVINVFRALAGRLLDMVTTQDPDARIAEIAKRLEAMKSKES